MQSSTKAILLSLAIIITPILFVLAYVFLYIPSLYTPEKMRAKGEEGYQEGRSAGRTMDENRCLASAVADYKSGQLEAPKAKGWLIGCLQVSRSNEAFCDGVPSAADRPGESWQGQACKSRGFNKYCEFYMVVVQGHCTGDY
jgi:hypothetical protein